MAAETIGSLMVKIGADMTDFEKAANEFDKSFGKVGKQVSDAGQKIGTAFTAAGATIGLALGGAVKSAADFEQSIADVKSVMDPADVDKYGASLSELAIKMGADTKYSATEAAKGIEELVKAGVSAEDIMSGGLKGALSLATAGELELADAAELASTALNAFKNDGLTVQQAADILAGAANASATSVHELKFGLAAVSAVASGVGLSFDDTTTALAAFAQNGLKGSDAGTSLKTMLLNLQPSTKAQVSEFQRLNLMTYDAQKAFQLLKDNGITPASNSFEDVDQALKKFAAEQEGAKEGSVKAQNAYMQLAMQTGVLSSKFYDATGSIRPMNEIAGILQESLSGMTDAQRAASLEIMFGTDAIRAGNILYKEGADGLNNMNKAMHAITADQVAETKMNTLNGSLEQLRGGLETFAISVGTALLPAVRAFSQWLGKIMDVFNSLSPATKSFIAIGAALTTGLLLLAGAVGFLVAGFGILAAAQWAVLLPILGIVAAVTAAIAILTALTIVIYENWDNIVAFLNSVWEGIKSAAIAIWGSLAEMFSAVWADVKAGASSAWAGIVDFFAATWVVIVNGVNAAWDGVKSFLSGTWSAIKSTASSIWGSVVDFFSQTWDRVTEMFTNVWDAIGPIVTVGLKNVFAIIKGVWQTIVMVLDEGWQFIKSLFAAAFLSIVGLVTGNMDLIKQAWGGFASNVKDIVLRLGQGLYEIWDQAWSSIKTNTQAAWDALVNLFVSAGKQIWNNLVSTWNSLRDAWNDGVEAVKAAGKAFWSDLISFFVNGGLAIWEKMNSTWDKIKESFKQGVDNSKTSIHEMWTSIMTSFAEAPGKIWSFLVDIGNRLKDGWDQMKADAIEMGANIIKGLIDGIGSMGTALVDKAKSMVSGAIDSAKSVLGIHSPSRVFMEIGGFTGEGFALGLQDSYPEVQGSMEHMLSMPTIQPLGSAGVGGGANSGNGGSTLIIELDGRTIAKSVGPHLQDITRIRTGMKI
ncbi:hypothetical protein J31TS4_19160 [Paenibacillus sp. J31TS4]|uniref:phage tail tape measure protein n=1 Tax=Paenibacillus sp. J31TS4 TaxID=2807195 RepID=UPI001B198595|nr:phage tail tape measure protein [Paenibacillus sp. J31TS4]GIP38636.1 hypothetical protein J31TS4_19160 [Paenibacillus sp. J31TS4]